MAYRVAQADARPAIEYLREREQVTGVYREQHAPVRLADGGGTHVRAMFYAAERAHPQYAGSLPLRVQAAIIRSARGHSGLNTEYLFNTVGHLGELGFRDRRLERLAALVGKLEERHHGNPHVHTSAGTPKPRHRAPQGSHAAPLSRDMQFRFRFRRNLRQALHDAD
jgi:cation transport protein ChaC